MLVRGEEVSFTKNLSSYVVKKKKNLMNIPLIYSCNKECLFDISLSKATS